jgi:hypothetical protein
MGLAYLVCSPRSDKNNAGQVVIQYSTVQYSSTESPFKGQLNPNNIDCPLFAHVKLYVEFVPRDALLAIYFSLSFLNSNFKKKSTRKRKEKKNDSMYKIIISTTHKENSKEKRRKREERNTLH